MRDWTGLLSGIGAFALWGVFPIYFKWLALVPATEVLAHRIIWSLVFLALGLLLMGRSPQWKQVFADRRLLFYMFSSASLIAVNWLIFIEAVIRGLTIEASFGYFMNPLLIVAMGVLFFRERLSLGQKISLLLALSAVLYQVISMGALPWISLALAVSFGLYGMIRKIAKVDSMRGLFIETFLLSPLALIYLFFRFHDGTLWFGFHGLPNALLLVCAGLVTSVPLVLFAIGVKRLPYATVGFLQYISPSLQFLVAVFLFQETLHPEKLISFVLVWIGLIILVLSPRIQSLRLRPKVR